MLPRNFCHPGCQNTIEVKILSRSIKFRSKFSTEIKIFLKPVLHRGQKRNAVIDQSMQIIQFVTTSTKRKRCNLLLLGQILDFRDGGAWRHAEGRSTTSMLDSKFDAIQNFFEN